ncbi:TetR/AcrR family transcriptional regulator [Rhizobium lentis]|uniref:TetR/AcrR family transcriptional regulator n=2 Tax=Rhizobium/Agrobacterium group TaxID=227290 RepID=UPI001C828CC0|nr:TetR/AcrR family transcriptional regulator [Rhizobium lentis]MBX5041312.1 TetR/AcrR family transcriptional regulator [Rhizobium lentis]MBX5071568.1 TetR/AcrR family transcriptional regulator [Rhizobium lentis]MBX5108394.1 TetR/AcrR family transcriptional regulator [Rhizobium lentis]MBX5117370.1 TetR/AcrR family transcriptional regulator [Rhizobium lentis]MBX5178999.1 TetR/AcrR family transcriptional regulator [Rhizobium lentis]
MARRKFSKEQMISAARDIALQRGAGRVTLEAVAEAIGSTKGAVLHSFPTKSALLQELLAAMCGEWDTRFDDVRMRSGKSRGVLTSYIKTWREADPQAPSYLEAVAVAKAENPDLLEPVRDAYGRYAQLIEGETGNKMEFLVAWMACEGMVMLDLLGLHRFDEKTKAALFDQLEMMVGVERT